MPASGEVDHRSKRLSFLHVSAWLGLVRSSSPDSAPTNCCGALSDRRRTRRSPSLSCLVRDVPFMTLRVTTELVL